MMMQDNKRRRYKARPPTPPNADDLRWQRFKAELPERIAAIRAEAPTVCTACGSTRPEVVERQTCSVCRESLPLALFYRDRGKTRGRDFRCKECRREDDRVGRADRRKRDAIAAIGGSA